ncbi:MORC family CW-type zinc finger protein 3a [Enoplosus armatus]|uniref:MORC family CW-type zinc finger protein 3a n=1 Tax=Enoplosus armatus TaxID=215367 RepID=UPI003995F284
MAVQSDRGVPLSTLCPKYLHTNSTSHTWPFSAIAELIDNAYDPDVSAKHFWIDKTMVKGEECLSFMDNGNGLDHVAMRKMLSFGYSDKVAVNGIKPIGMYGNGFKSGAMRLGKDAIVFSRSKNTTCVGMLSQTYLEKLCAEQIIVPIVCFEQSETNQEEDKASLRDILRYSSFNTQKDLLDEVNAISSSGSGGKTGTRIIIWNLRRTSTSTTEFDFEKDRYDIRIPSDVYEEINDTSQPPRVTSYVPDSVCSLRAYCSILYLKPRMQIIIRGQKVKSQLIAKSLAYIRKDHYKPTFLPKRIPITFGYNTKSKDQYGIMMYHKNRLIKAYERVGCQLKANQKGVGVIGIIECYFLEPTHNKQNFNETDKYRKTMINLGTKLEEYWQEINHKRKTEDPNNSIPVEDTIKRPDQNWVQCDDCSKWRKLPDGIDCSKLPDKWFCLKNPDPQFRSCNVEEEPVDSDGDQPSYHKTYKQQVRGEKKNEENKRQKEEEDRKRQEEQRLADLAKKNRALERSLKQQLQQTVHSPSTPTTPRRRLNTESPRQGAARAKSSSLRASTISQAACSPSSSSGLPVISNVCSLSPGPLRGKRTQPVTPQGTPKRPRENDFHQGTSDTSTSVDASPLSFPSVPINHDGDDDDDEDIFILETVSTPKPKKTGFDLTKVKTEQEQSDINVDVVSETNVAETGSAGSAAVGTSPSPAPLTEVTSITTQTEVHKVKKEEEDRNQTEGEERVGQSSDMGIDVCVEQSAFKKESNGDTHIENQGKQTLRNGGMHLLASDEEAGPSCADTSQLHLPSMTDIEEQQEQLLEMMQTTAQERDSFKEQLDSVEKQRAILASQCEELKLQLQQQRERAREGSATPRRVTDSSVQTDPNEAGGIAVSVTDSSSDWFKSLIELRHNVGRLLVSTMPALELDQVNYECNVIDEILEQFLSNV